MIWGGVPTDKEYVRNTNIFKEGVKRFYAGEFDKFWRPTIQDQFERFNEFERKLILKYSGERFEEYKNLPCRTKGMALCYLINFRESAEYPMLGKYFWNYAIK